MKIVARKYQVDTFRRPQVFFSLEINDNIFQRLGNCGKSLCALYGLAESTYLRGYACISTP